MRETLADILNKTMVVDTDSPWIYIGTLRSVGQDGLHLIEADAHWGGDSSSTKEMYIYETRQNGLQVNRQEVSINLARVLSISPLSSIRLFL